ncbi:uncharacterized protein LOC141618199 [Silene latifolia]|uniref:uncharacterized protein LOC141618199 n=1 Tax=Silene latifolia TaxID=37657 RepID=UPI003D76BDA7
MENNGRATSKLKRLPDDYCSASGQVIKEGKSGIVFCPNSTLRKVKTCLKDLKIRKNRGFGKYVGMPTEFQASKKDVFKGLVENVSKHISSWNGVFLSPAGRLTLISYVLSNISNYFLSVFKIPRLVTEENSLFCKIFREKILGKTNVKEGLRLSLNGNLSWGVRIVVHGLNFILENISWKPGIESNMNVWSTKWVNGCSPEPFESLLGAEFRFLKDLRVKDLKWLIKLLFSEESVNRILAIPIRRTWIRDEVVCHLSNSGIYTVKSGYSLIFNKFFSEKGLREDNARERVSEKKHGAEPFFVMCGTGRNFPETIDHLFRDCAVSLRIWSGSSLGINTVSIWKMRNDIIFYGEKFIPLVFFKQYARLMNVATEAAKKGEEDNKILQRNIEECQSHDPDVLLLKKGRPDFVVGSYGACLIVKIQVDTSWETSYDTAYGWVVLNE